MKLDRALGAREWLHPGALAARGK
jgi:hypothetical protein